jgi:putative acetyltransferase
MGAVYRLAMCNDASGLYEVRRQSILELAPPKISVAEAQAWAAQLTRSGMERKLRELKMGCRAGWRGGRMAAIRDDRL